MFPTIIHNRVDYAASMTDGRTALELDPGRPAALEFTELWPLVKAASTREPETCIREKE